MDAFRDHLSRARKSLSDNKIQKVLVLGNESADCDSLVSSCVLSFGLQQRLDGSKDQTRSVRSPVVFIPVFNLLPEDFALRTEVAELFSQLGWREDDVTAEAFFRGVLDTLSNVPIVLVDHNRLAAFQEDLEGRVCAIVDHHVDERRCPGATDSTEDVAGAGATAIAEPSMKEACNIVQEGLGGRRRIIEVVGSCSTLVAEQCGLAGGPSSNSDSDVTLPESLAKLLMAAILLDTANFDPDMKKATEKDVNVAVRLARMLGWSDARGEGTQFSSQAAMSFGEQLGKWRFDVSRLSTKDCLRQDYKQFTMGNRNIGIASVRRSVQSWIAKESGLDGFVTGLDSYARELALDVLFAMVVYSDDHGFHRELVVFSRDRSLFDKIVSHLQSGASDPNLRLELISEAFVERDGCYVACFDQKYLNGSRKQLQPILTALLG